VNLKWAIDSRMKTGAFPFGAVDSVWLCVVRPFWQYREEGIAEGSRSIY